MNINHLLNKPGSNSISDNFIILKVWQTVTLQPFDLQRPTIPPWKDLKLIKSNQSENHIYPPTPKQLCVLAYQGSFHGDSTVYRSHAYRALAFY